MPILKKEADSEAVLAAAAGLEAALKGAGVRAKLDADTGKTPGWKFNYYEMKGVPLRVEASASGSGSGSAGASRAGVPRAPRALRAHISSLY